ncbi:MAG: prepilin-type N-terminal cleavage/methylation domain-containing protein [Gammaproteobacteria bacterium]|nr:prepilin-type N-terminal cleavage/methylation domain-containing protein [Gammaproteobacteria bacterium]
MNRLQKRRPEAGFTMIEVLIALVVFALGVLGLSQITGNAIVIASDNNARAVALDVASQQLEPLYVAAGNGNAAFKVGLNAFAGGLAVNGNGGRDSYTITITQAQDSSVPPVDLLTDNNTAAWVSPFNVAASVSYAGRNGTKTALASFNFVSTGP